MVIHIPSSLSLTTFFERLFPYRFSVGCFVADTRVVETAANVQSSNRDLHPFKSAVFQPVNMDLPASLHRAFLNGPNGTVRAPGSFFITDRFR